jgi:hypothetical protein
MSPGLTSKFQHSSNKVHLRVLYGYRKQQHLFPYKALLYWFLGAFAKFRRATVNFVMFVYLSGVPHGKNRLPLDGV